MAVAKRRTAKVALQKTDISQERSWKEASMMWNVDTEIEGLSILLSACPYISTWFVSTPWLPSRLLMSPTSFTFMPSSSLMVCTDWLPFLSVTSTLLLAVLAAWPCVDGEHRHTWGRSRTGQSSTEQDRTGNMGWKAGQGEGRGRSVEDVRNMWNIRMRMIRRTVPPLLPSSKRCVSWVRSYHQHQ